MNWHRVGINHYRCRLDSGTYDARRIGGRWTLWVQAALTGGFIRKRGSWENLVAAKYYVRVLDKERQRELSVLQRRQT